MSPGRERVAARAGGQVREPEPHAPGAVPGVAHPVLSVPGAPLSPAQVLHLQRTLGNRAVGRLLHAKRTATPSGVQRAPSATARNSEEWESERDKQLTKHKQNQKKIYDLVDANVIPLVKPPTHPGVPADREEVFRNTAEIIKARCILVALTPTLSTRLYPPGKPKLPASALSGNLFFDERVAYPLKGAEDAAAVEGVDAANEGSYTRTTGESAHADPAGRPLTMRVFMDRDFSEESLKTVLIHETQHLADRHGPSALEGDKGSFEGSAIADVNKTDGDVANGYRTEFRAYWMRDKGGGKSFGDPAKKAANTRKLQWGTLLVWRYLNTEFKNERQENIFWYMVDAGIYPWVKVNYYFTPAFTKLVNELDVPSGGNLINSIRIDDLRFELREMEKVTAKLTEELKDEAPGSEDDLLWDGEERRLVNQHKEVAKAAKALNATDRAFLKSAAAKPFWDFFERCYAPGIRVVRVDFVKQHVKALETAQIKDA